MNKPKNLEGMRFGRLIAFRLHPKRLRRRAQWVCICDCGNVHTVTSDRLLSGNTKSCGCLNHEVKLPEGEVAFRQVIGIYKLNAKKRGLSFLLTDDQFRDITQMECHYCGSHLSMTKVNGRGNGSFRHNGVDRVDNESGYTLDNCVPCCDICNRAKAAMKYSDFIQWISKIKEYGKQRTLV